MEPTVENLFKIMKDLPDEQFERLDSDQQEAFAQLLNYLSIDLEESK